MYKVKEKTIIRDKGRKLLLEVQGVEIKEKTYIKG